MQILPTLPEASVDLAFADPPFNIGYDYDVYNDRRGRAEYLTWTEQWLQAVRRVLKPDGSVFVAIGDEYAAEMKVRLDALGLNMRNWIVWHYTFGVHCTKKFNRSHAHIFYFVADPKRFTFNADEIRVPSRPADDLRRPAGQSQGSSCRTTPGCCGRRRTSSFFKPHERHLVRLARLRHVQGADGASVPDAGGGAGADHPRGEQSRATWCSTRSPGSGTTLAVAKRLGRRCLGIELSAEYADRVRQRLDQLPGSILQAE